MSAKHPLRAAFAGAVLLGVYLGLPTPADGHQQHAAYEQIFTSAIDRTDVPWQASAVEDPDHICAF